MGVGLYRADGKIKIGNDRLSETDFQPDLVMRQSIFVIRFLCEKHGSIKTKF